MPAEFTVFGLPFLVALVVSLVFAPGTIAALKRRGVGQTISEDGPESHRPKAGTPTMGGLIILAGILAGALAISWALNRQSIWFAGAEGTRRGQDLLTAAVLLMLGYAIVGLVDDYLTIHPVRGVRGISSKPKAAVQLLLAIAFVMWLAQYSGGFVPRLMVGNTVLLEGSLYWVFAVVFIVGMANFINITDGLDGLASGLSAIAALAFALVIVLAASARGDEAPELLSLTMAIGGACVAFLWFNANPARVFMGDTGSLALGVALPAIAVLTHREILMMVIGLVFIVDGASTIIQWAVFKYTRITTGTGRRVFKKSPIHHHFEMSGWLEQLVVVRFWIMGIIAALLGFAGAAWRWW